MTTELLADIRRAVERAGECEAQHVESVAVVEMFRGKTVWEGIVESFKLTGHPKAKRAYGWAYQDDEETRYVAVLELPPVDSANTAVRAAIAAGAQN
jgi:hypothetical protein